MLPWFDFVIVFSGFSWFFVMMLLIYCDIVYLCSYGSSSCCIVLIVTVFICVLMVLLMLHWIDCDIVYLCSHGSSSCRIGLIVALFICILMVLTHVALDWLWQYLSVFLWVFFMLHLIDCDIVYLCSHRSASCCLWLIEALFICVLMGLSHVALDWLWHCLSVFSWFFLMLPWIDCDIVYLCSYDLSSYCLGLIVTLFICVLMVLSHVALYWLWHCLSVFLWLFLILHWIECDIVYLCFHGSSSCCIGMIVTLFICVLMVLPRAALDWLWHCLAVFSWFFLMLPWIDCDIVYLCSCCSSSCCIWLWHCLSVFSWLFLMLYLIDCGIVYLSSHGSSSCCIGLIVTLFICVLMVLPHVALDWFWQCLSVFLWFFLMLHWIDCDIVYLCSHGSSSCCLGLIVISFFLCFHGSLSCCFWFIVTLFIFVLMVLPHVALDWLWHCISVFLWVFLMLHWIDCDIAYLCSYGSSLCCIELIVTLFICVLVVLPHVALDWLWHCLSVFSWFLLMFHWIDCDSIYLCSYGSSLCCTWLIVTMFNGSSSCCIWLIVILFIYVLMVPPHFALDWLWHCLLMFLWVFLM